MTEIDAALMHRKLARIGTALAGLMEVESLSLEVYRRGLLRKKGTERLLQEIVDAAVDINLHLLRATGAEAPPDYESFIRLARLGAIPAQLGAELAPAAGLRNRLVHEYDEIDDAIVLASVSEARVRFGRYIAEVERYLTAQGR